MAGYHFLDGITVIEVAQFGPDSLGGFLADLGATVIKVESVEGGDPIRFSGEAGLGSDQGFGLLHTRWNRGKQSIGLDLKSEAGATVFKQLIADAHVVVEGLRAGVMQRLGLGAETLQQINPALVYCTLTGLGSGGPYSGLGSQGPSFDAFGGLTALAAAGGEIKPLPVPVGMYAMGLYAALGTVAAVRSAERTGQGAILEIAAADCSAHWLPAHVDAVLNAEVLVTRPTFANAEGRMAKWSRLHPYPTADGAVLFQGLYDKFWLNFCGATNRPDLVELANRPDLDQAEIDNAVHDRLRELFAERTTEEWMTLFLAHDVPGVPVNSAAELAVDPHFVARGNMYTLTDDAGRTLRFTGTPIKVAGADFAPALAPDFAVDTDQILAAAGFDADAIAALRADGVIV